MLVSSVPLPASAQVCDSLEVIGGEAIPTPPLFRGAGYKVHSTSAGTSQCKRPALVESMSRQITDPLREKGCWVFQTPVLSLIM